MFMHEYILFNRVSKLSECANMKCVFFLNVCCKWVYWIPTNDWRSEGGFNCYYMVCVQRCLASFIVRAIDTRIRLLLHIRIVDVTKWDKRFLYRLGGCPAQAIMRTASFVVGAWKLCKISERNNTGKYPYFHFSTQNCALIQRTHKMCMK